MAATAVKPSAKEIAQGEREFAKALRNKPDEHILCRAMKHAWIQEKNIQFRPAIARGDLPMLVISFVCERGCNVKRKNRITVRKTGPNTYKIIERHKPDYERPEDYPIHGIPRGVQPGNILWQDLIRRQAETIAHAEPGDRMTAER